MTWRWADASGALALLLAAGSGAAHAQRSVETGVHGLATFADYTFAGGGRHLGLRPGGRTRFVLTVTPGVADETFALRGESTAQFMLNPGSRQRGFYAGGGLAGITGPVDEAWLLLVVGMETSPGGRSSWVVETGIGGGVRVLLGYRWRRFSR
jgi:hypothetical protein